MKKLLLISFTLFFITQLSAQRLKNSSGTIIGYVEDGRVKNSSGSIFGYFEGIRRIDAALYFYFFFY